MTRTYELGFIVEPRTSEDDAHAILDKFKGMITDSGANITHVDHWGKRKLAYPIRKYKEGRYFFVYVSSDVTVPWPDVERLMMQDEKILRHLVVRTDEDIKRAMRKGKVKPQIPGAEENGSGDNEKAADEKAADEKADEKAADEKVDDKKAGDTEKADDSKKDGGE